MAEESKFSDIAAQIGLSPLESPAIIRQGEGKIQIGVPKEHSFQEKRTPLTPRSVSLLVARGNEVIIETGAGEGSRFKDTDYSEAGAQIANNLEEVYKAKVILQVTPPQEEELKLMHPGQLIISPIHLSAMNEKYIHTMMEKKVTALAFEYLKDDFGTFPMVRSMSEIAGSTAILIAAECISNLNKGKGLLLGGVSGVPSTRVVILGAGVVGEFASRTAMGLGANVIVFDNSVYKLMRLQNNIGSRLSTCNIQPDVLANELENCDVVIGAMHATEGRTPVIVTEDMVANMKPGSVIIDVSIDQGGCFETSQVTTHDKPTFRKYDVIHYCVPNIASRVSRTASSAISNILTPLLLKGNEMGGIEKLLWYHEGTRHGVYVYNGSLTNQYLSDKLDIKYTDLDLLFAANI
jgi:alanine dehydrogenase